MEDRLIPKLVYKTKTKVRNRHLYNVLEDTEFLKKLSDKFGKSEDFIIELVEDYFRHCAEVLLTDRFGINVGSLMNLTVRSRKKRVIDVLKSNQIDKIIYEPNYDTNKLNFKVYLRAAYDVDGVLKVHKDHKLTYKKYHYTSTVAFRKALSDKIKAGDYKEYIISENKQ